VNPEHEREDAAGPVRVDPVEESDADAAALDAPGPVRVDPVEENDADAAVPDAPGPVPVDPTEEAAADAPESAGPATSDGSPELPTEDDAYRRSRRGGESPGPVSDEDLRPALEAILVVVDTPVSEITLAQILERPLGDIRPALERLAADYTESSRGMDLRRVAGGWRLYTRDAYAPYVERFVLDGQQARLTQAALETLAVVAYRQPVTRSRISAIRGVGVDGVMRTLVTRGLIEECGAEPESGAHLYRTTTLFLEKLGLNSLEELPPLAPLLPEIEALDDVIGSA
jgi:segregation and condensation protein B